MNLKTLKKLERQVAKVAQLKQKRKAELLEKYRTVRVKLQLLPFD